MAHPVKPGNDEEVAADMLIPRIANLRGKRVKFYP